MISVPKGMLRLATLKLLSGSSMSGADLSEEIRRMTQGAWTPGPGSIYLMLGELLRKGFITELSKREGNLRRYIISAKGKGELHKLSGGTRADVARQLRLLGVYSGLAGEAALQKKVNALADDLPS